VKVPFRFTPRALGRQMFQAAVCLFMLGAWGASRTWLRPAGAMDFAASQAGSEAGYEQLFRSVPTAVKAREDLRILTLHPHVAGTPADYQTARYVLEQFQKAGLHAEIVEYQVLLPMPEEVRVELIAPAAQLIATNERSEVARVGTNNSEVIAAFNAFSPSGEITAPVVYANYGLPEDYAQLKQMGVDVAGKIVMVRYGKCFRGVKATVAGMNHAGALLIYSDPADDGFRQGKVWPRGPWRPETAVQRGSILPLSSYAGDPLTPGVPAVRSASRLDMKNVPLPRIMTTPLSYREAAPILRNLQGPAAPRSWQGGLPFSYRVGPGSSKVHIKLSMDYRLRPIWNVVARIPGKSTPEEWVVAGNHRDAWTYGAADPGSGTAPLIALGRGLGELLQRGWKPRRTIVLASWDAEEFGLMGSTEWAEEHAAEIARHAVAYLNVDVGVCGRNFGAAAVPSLNRLIRDVTRDVSDPETGRTVHDLWRERTQAASPGTSGSRAAGREPVPATPEARVRELGSGSDYTVFLEHLGVPSLDFGFSGPYGVYHSRFDDFDWMQKFGDPDFRYSVAAAQIFGMLVMRLADADILPMDYQEYGNTLQEYLRELDMETKRQHPTGKIEVAGALRSAMVFTRVAGAVRQRAAEVRKRGGLQDPGGAAMVNQSLLGVERNFLLDKGLPGRSWFRHAFYAPGVYTGYRAVILPGVREAIDRNDWAAAQEQLGLVQAAIERGTSTLNRVLAVLGERPKRRDATSSVEGE
jgi:N-acetylated-alpha-linked acidic dipeptidase